MTSRHSATPLGLPGRVTISVRPRIPATDRLIMAIGVFSRVRARMVSARPGTLPVDNGEAGLGSHVGGRHAGAAGGHDEVQAVAVAPVGEPSCDHVAVVGHDLVADALVVGGSKRLLDGLAAGVLAAAVETRGADGENA